MACPHERTDTACWPFAVPDETRVFASVRVLRQALPVLMVSHDDDGDWVFSCGTTGEPAHTHDACLGCLVDADPRLAELADLPRGWLAYRLDPAGRWERGPLPDDESIVDTLLHNW